jgi:hypothetical protein
MLKKILLNREFVPNNHFDWSLNPGDNLNFNERNQNNLSMSSCGIPDEEQPWNENVNHHDRQKNIKKIKDEYSMASRPAEYLMKHASNT